MRSAAAGRGGRKSAANGPRAPASASSRLSHDGVALEDGRLLELPADAERGDGRLVEPGEVDRAVEIDVAGVGPRLAGDHVHHGGLAGAVRADDGAHLARLDDQRQLVQRLKPSKETVTPSR